MLEHEAYLHMYQKRMTIAREKLAQLSDIKRIEKNQANHREWDSAMRTASIQLHLKNELYQNLRDAEIQLNRAIANRLDLDEKIKLQKEFEALIEKVLQII